MSNKRRVRARPSTAHTNPDAFWSDPRAQAWRRQVETELVPKIKASTVTAAIWPPGGEPDAKIAVELGYSLLLGKPVVLVVSEDDVIPPALERLCDAIVRGDIRSPEGRAAVSEQVKDALSRIVSGNGDEPA